MMFAFFFALGAWAVTLSTYLMSAPTKGGLNFTTQEVGWIYSTFAFGGMAAQFFVGLLADRLFRADRVLAVACVLCAGLVFAAAKWCDRQFPLMDEAYRSAAHLQRVGGESALDLHGKLDPAAALSGGAVVSPTHAEVRVALDRVNEDPRVRRVAAETFRVLFPLMLAYCFFLHIALTLTTVTALRNLPDAGEFARVRMYGTVGWIAAGVIVGVVLRDVSTEPLYLAAGASAVTGVYAFTLPRTAPRGQGKTLAEAFGVPALKLVRDRSFAVFIAVAFVAASMNQFYGVYAHRYLTDLHVPYPALTMTIGQCCEVAVMFAIPLLNPRKHLKTLMMVGLAGYVVRGVAMTCGWVPGVILFGVTMHGWSYAFFYVVAATYIDREAPPHLRASAQAIVSFVVSGAAVLAGNLLAGAVVDEWRTGTVIEWSPVWAVPLVGCVATFVSFGGLFRPPPDEPP